MSKENIEETLVPTPEELKEEEEAVAEAKEDEVRNSIIEKYGLDEDEQSDLIDSIVKDQLEQRKAFGKVVGQKIKYREAATTKPAPSKEAPKENETSADVEARIKKEFEQRDLDDMDLPDELKSEVQRLATVQGISVRQASKDPYIIFKKEDYEKNAKIEGATVSRTNKGKTVKFDVSKPPAPNMATEEGRKEWDDYKKFLASQ